MPILICLFGIQSTCKTFICIHFVPVFLLLSLLRCFTSTAYIVFWCYCIHRCRMWVENCRRADLEAKTAEQLNKHYRLCAKHFDPAMVCKTVSSEQWPHTECIQIQNTERLLTDLLVFNCLYISEPVSNGVEGYSHPHYVRSDKPLDKST